MAPAPPCKASAASTASGRIAVQYFRMWIAAVLAVAGVQRLVSAGLSLDVDVGSGRFNLSVDGTSWLPGGGAATVRGAALGLQRWSRGTGIDAHGAFDAAAALEMRTAWRQSWPQGNAHAALRGLQTPQASRAPTRHAQPVCRPGRPQREQGRGAGWLSRAGQGGDPWL